MRTTVDIDAILLKRLRDVAHERGMPLKDVLNGVLRRGLERDVAGASEKFCGPSFPMGVPMFPQQFDKALALADVLADEEIARKLLLRK